LSTWSTGNKDPRIMNPSLGYLLVVVAAAIASVSSLSCMSCDQLVCPKPASCKGGIVKDVCGCCDVCAKLEGEECGGAWDMSGKCARGLRCVRKDPLKTPFELEVGVCKPDKCAKKRCGDGEVCSIVEGEAKCTCPTSCKHTRSTVCEVGSGTEFINACFLKKHQCKTGQKLDYRVGPCRKCHSSGKMYRTGEVMYKKRNCQICTCRNGSWKCKSKCKADAKIPCKVSMVFNELVCPSGMKCQVDISLGEKLIPGICVPIVRQKGSVEAATHEPTQPPFLPVKKDICKLPVSQGPCGTVRHIRWYYNKEAKDCMKFRYGGCFGNSNNFKSREDCRRRCKKEDFDEKKEACSMVPHHGPCNDGLKRWFFNPKLGKCQTFMYGGCGANANNFLTRKQCNHFCKKRENKN